MPSGNKPWHKQILTKIYVAICIYDSSEQNELTHQGTVTYLYDNELCNQWFCYWRLVCWAQSHYLNWCWSIVDLTLGNIFQRSLNDDKKNSSSGMYLQMSSVSWRPFCFAFNVLNAAANYTIWYTCDCGVSHNAQLRITHRGRVMHTLIAMFMGPTWGPSGADRTQVGSMFSPINFAIWIHMSVI